jgi:RluA family pseudouridine synthase
MNDTPTPAVPTLLDRLRALHPQAKTTTLRQMLTDKRVLLNGVTAKSLKTPVTKRDKVEIADHAASAREVTLTHGLKLVHQDSQIVLIDKPSGLLSATDAQEKRPTVLKLLTAFFQKQNHKNQVHLIHRLDKDASGLLLFARSWDAYRALKEQFFEHTITRRYDVIVHGSPKKKQGRLEDLLVEDPETGVVRVTRDLKKGKLAILDYVVMQTDAKRNIAHVRCTLFTGRKHQIRVQLQALGHPVVADPTYALPGKPPMPLEPPGRLALHASHLTFVHPGTKRKVEFDSPMPGAFAHLFRSGG